jgi:hypothetical protein
MNNAVSLLDFSQLSVNVLIRVDRSRNWYVFLIIYLLISLIYLNYLLYLRCGRAYLSPYKLALPQVGI